MNDILRLVRVGFDSLENHNARYEETVGVFIETIEFSAIEHMDRWFKNHPQKLYFGYDHQVYPQWKVITDTILNISKDDK